MEMNKAILITGTSTGIGKTCALHLDKMGYRVYAGVRKRTDGENLLKEASGRLKPLMLDVTDTESISKAFEMVNEETGGELYGLINNAGIGRGGALEVTPIAEIRKVMDVNIIGLMAVTKIFIPLLRKSRGRIINVGSTSAYLAIPGASVYSASKFAVRAFTDSLRLELKPFGIEVILISPGAIKSAIWEKGKAYREKLRESIDPEIAELYSPLRKFGDRLYEIVKPIPSIEVAKIVEKALRVRKPKRYYFVGKDVRSAAKVSRLPKSLLDWIILKRIQKLGK
jgi:NAD(P)-dependent dehydrogenase (short-subunit alcohol dehydrogenase family)